MSKKLFEKLKGSLGEDTVNEITQTFTEALEDGVRLRTAEKIKLLEEKSEEFVQKKVSSLMEAKEKQLIEEYETRYKEYADELTGHLDMFLESEVVDTISESIIEDVAKVQMYAPIIKDIMESFTKNYSPIAPKDQDSALADALKEKSELAKMYEKVMKENKKLSEMSERAAVRVLFTEKTQGMVKSAKVRIWEMIKDMDFDTADSKIGSLVSLVEEFSDPEDVSIGGIGGEDTMTDPDGDDDMGDVGDDEEVETTYPITLPKADFDAMVDIEVLDDQEDVPMAKQVADLISSYVVESEDGVEDMENVTLEIPESVAQELKIMFTTEEGEIDEEAFGDIAEGVKSALVEFIDLVPSDDDGMGDEGDLGDDYGDDDGMGDMGDETPVTEWYQRWSSK